MKPETANPKPDFFCVTVLGSGTGVPLKTRQAPGLVIQAGTTHILLDSGSGAAYQLARAGFQYDRFDYLLYSHYAHPDHINDLPELLFANEYFAPQPRKPLSIYGPKGIKNFLTRLIDLYPVLGKVKYPIEVYELEQDTIIINDITVKTKPLRHEQNACVGYRVEYQGKTIIYSGDTDYCRALIELARQSDLLIVECSFPDHHKVEGHLTPGEIGEIAAEAQVKKVILTHLYPLCDHFDVVSQVRKKFSGEVIRADDLMQVVI